jgi:very-short-patch-repair endonuclease
MTDLVDRIMTTLPSTIGWHVTNWMNDPAAQRCESPIEKLLLAAITLSITTNHWSFNRSIDRLIANDKPLGVPNAWPFFTIVSQWPLGNYRIDFMVFVQGGHQFAVECDGHDFHERTAEQAEYDRSRDRALQQLDIASLRFTGREIYRDPFECANEVIQFAMKKLHQVDNGS